MSRSAASNSEAAPVPWWRRALIYQIYPRSFADGNGVGERLDYLRRLGVDGVWLSPIYSSPMADFGYDVAGHCAVDALFGDLAGFDELLAACRDAGLRVLLDWVLNHTSDRHPWFLDSRRDRTSERRDWNVWRDGERERPPNYCGRRSEDRRGRGTTRPGSGTCTFSCPSSPT